MAGSIATDPYMQDMKDELSMLGSDSEPEDSYYGSENGWAPGSDVEEEAVEYAPLIYFQGLILELGVCGSGQH